MKTRKIQIALVLCIFCAACNTETKTETLAEIKSETVPIVGTWELVSATSTEKDSTVSTFNSRLRMIKIINATHFAFLSHDISGATDSTAIPFSAGGGAYTLVDSIYTENLEYFKDKAWENNKFEFIVSFSGDTLIQKGIEKIEKLGVDHIIVEKYKRISAVQK